MSSNRIEFDGLEELREALRNLPAELTEEASSIVIGAADTARLNMHYPRVTGDLAEHLTVAALPSGEFSAGAIVKNTAKHAYIFENGSQARHYYTKNGVKHLTGAMPAGRAFIPPVMRARRDMYGKLKEMLTREGLEVSGDA